MTSNIGTQWIQDLAGREEKEMERRVMESLRATFKPEFLNRIDETVIFNSLGPDEIKEIVGIQVGILGRRLKDGKITLELTDGAKEFLAKAGFDPVYGARPLKRAIQQLIQDPLSMKILEGSVKEGDHIKADERNGEIVFR
jgi:ATP-dependent Clp protease ATP-binding subunit ClpB